VSESIARRILSAHPSIPLAGEKRQATVLISDIRGFTRMIKDLGAEEVVNTLNDYFARMIDIIFQYEGTVNKFIGDAIVVLYGVPLASGDEPRRAIQTAHAMQQAVAAMNAGRAQRGQPPLHIGIAIDLGEVVVGNIGSPRRMEYTAIGTPVNTAYQLASLAPADTIYITENVYRLVPNLDARAGERIQLKGDTGETNVYVLALDGETQPPILSNLEPPISALRPEAQT
jgi:adenylate cyclase